MGHNTTGPPWSVTDDDDRCQQALLVWTTYTGMCRQTSNNMWEFLSGFAECCLMFVCVICLFRIEMRRIWNPATLLWMRIVNSRLVSILCFTEIYYIYYWWNSRHLDTFIMFCLYIFATFYSRWRYGRALDLWSTGRGFKSYSGKSCVTTLGKLFTLTCLCHQTV